MKEITLLHIGDIHFQFIDKNDGQIDKKDERFPKRLDEILPRKNYQNVIKVLKKEIDNSPSAILMSGDLSTYGKIESYKNCLDFIKNSIPEKFFKDELSPRFFIVPGNHDIDREIEFDEKFQTINNVLSEMKFPKIPYPNAIIKELKEDSSTILVITMNSCIGCGEIIYYPIEIREAISKSINLNCEEQNVLCFDKIDTPIFTQDDIDEVIDHIKSAKDEYVPIILTHHNLLPQKVPRIAMYTELINSGHFRDRLFSLDRPIIYLHGHIHDNPVEIIQSIKYKYAKIICISAPLLFPNTEYKAQNFGFNKIKIVFNSDGHPLGCEINYYRINEGIDKKEEDRIRFNNPPDSLRLATKEDIIIFNSIYKQKEDVHLAHLKSITTKENGDCFSIDEMEESVDRLDWLGLVKYNNKKDVPNYMQTIKKVIPK